MSGGSVALFGNLHPEPGALGWEPLAGQSASRFGMLRDACKKAWNPWRHFLRLPHCSCAAPNTSRRSFPGRIEDVSYYAPLLPNETIKQLGHGQFMPSPSAQTQVSPPCCQSAEVAEPGSRREGSSTKRPWFGRLFGSMSLQSVHRLEVMGPRLSV